MDYTAVAVMIAGAVFFAKAAQMEKKSPFGWVAMSLGVSAALLLGLKSGWMGLAVGQVALFVAIALWRVAREKRTDNE